MRPGGCTTVALDQQERSESGVSLSSLLVWCGGNQVHPMSWLALQNTMRPSPWDTWLGTISKT